MNLGNEDGREAVRTIPGKAEKGPWDKEESRVPGMVSRPYKHSGRTHVGRRCQGTAQRGWC